MQIQSRGNPHYQRVGQNQNPPSPNLPYLSLGERNCSGPRAFHDWHNTPIIKRIRQLIRHRIAVILLRENYNDPGQLSIYLENLLLSEAASEDEYVNLKTLYHRLQKNSHRLLSDEISPQHAPKDFQCFPDDAIKPASTVDMSKEPVNSTGNGSNYSCYEARSYSTEHGTFLNYVNQFDGNGCQESFPQMLKRGPDNCFSNSINYDTSSGCLGDAFIPLKRPKIETSLFSYPSGVQLSASQRSSELPQQHNLFEILNGDVYAVDTKASTNFTRISPGTHEVWNDYSYNCSNKNAETAQVPPNTFIVDKDAEKMGYSRRFCRTWENVEKGSGMEENLTNDITQENGIVEEQNSDTMPVPSNQFIIDNDPLNIECPMKTFQTWNNVDNGCIYFDSSNFNLLNVGMDVDGLVHAESNWWMEENLYNCTDPEADHGKEQNSETMELPTEAVIIDEDPQKRGYSASTCKALENRDDPIKNELKLGNLNNSTAMEADHGKGETSVFFIREKEQNSEAVQVPPEAVIIEKDQQKTGYSASTCKTWENKEKYSVYSNSTNVNSQDEGIGVEDLVRNELELGNLNNVTAMEADHIKGKTSFFLIREKEQNLETVQVSPEAVIIEKDQQKTRYSASTCKTWENKEKYPVYSNSTNVNSQVEGMNVEDLVTNELKLENVNNYTTLEADHVEEHNHRTTPIPSEESIIDMGSHEIGCSASMCKTSENIKQGPICNDSSCVTFSKKSTEGKDEVRTEMDSNKYSVPKVDYDEIQNSERIKLSGVSLAEFFTEDEIRKHIWSLKQSDSLIATKDGGDIHLNVCDLCSTDNLFFAPLPLYCSNCASRIKQHRYYFCTTEENTLRHALCLSCHKLAVLKKGNLSKMTLEARNMCKKKNNEDTAESWVQCDKCERWQHQICALYNDNKDLEGKALYTCPKCLLKDIQHRDQRELKSGLVARDLPTTMLSDHIENRLFCSLKKERKLRAEMTGKRIDEVQGVEGLVVRVVSSVEKQLKVKNYFWDIFKKQNYPTTFPYRSKVIVVFQNIEGVDVCLFAMYIQEFGLECGPQNRRRVYISYLDSVKYFTPDMKSDNGEALRSFVYHEVMIASLEFFKKRGFASCYIWACPPTIGEDYIFYCHPKDQKTPKSVKLRKWYQLMLRKAAKEGIVVHVTNLYDHFFVTSEGSNLKVTATRLPYFEGDYWTTAAEKIIQSLEKDKEGGSNVKGNKQVTKRTLRAMGHEEPSNCSIDDILLMQKLGECILSSKEDFMIVQLQFFCIRCDEAILSGKRLFCSMCPNFHLCERCHSGTGPADRLNSHITNNKKKHMLSQEEVNIPFNTADDDVVIENTIFENRQCFLDSCQKKRWQFDTLRRAKHSSMMILYDLHSQNLTTMGKSSGLLPKLLQVAQHLSECIKRRDPGLCSIPHCNQMKKMFQHASICKTHSTGGCSVCHKAAYLLVMHSRKCENSECGIPGCNNTKKKRRSNSQSDLLPKGGTAAHSH